MKLQLGTSRFQRLTPAALRFFLNPGWVHLGDAAPQKPLTARMLGSIRDYGPVNFLRIVRDTIWRKIAAVTAKSAATDALPDFGDYKIVPFFFEKGDRLAFGDGDFAFVFSEHFFEHLFLDEAIALLQECFRILKHGGVIRIGVPDADLRTNRAPEPAGFPYQKMPFTHPEKHKTRWSMYSLSEALRIAGFEALPLRYFDREGRFHDHAPASVRASYPDPLEESDFVLTLGYLQRQESLIIDGIKRP